MNANTDTTNKYEDFDMHEVTISHFIWTFYYSDVPSL